MQLTEINWISHHKDQAYWMNAPWRPLSHIFLSLPFVLL